MNNYCLSLNVFYNHIIRFDILNNFCSVFTAQLIKHCQMSSVKSSSFKVFVDLSQCQMCSKHQ